MEAYTQIEALESFIKAEYTEHKIDERTANELLRITQEIKETISRTSSE